MHLSRTRRLLYVLTPVSLLLLGFVLLVVRNASRAVRNSAERVVSEAEMPFSSAPLERSAPPGFESFSSPSVFADAALFQGHLYLCGPAGLFQYDPEGKLVAKYRAGLELPAAPLVDLAAGLAAESGAPELFIATSGEGLLAFDGRTFRHIRPDQARFRRLTAVLPLPTGRILMGTERKGVIQYDGRSLTPFHPMLSDTHVTTLAGDDSVVWIGTLERGIFLWQAGEIRHVGGPEVLPDPRILSVAASGETVYAGTPMGVAEFVSGRFERTLASGFFARSLLVQGDTLLIGTLEEGVIPVPRRARPPRMPRPQGEALAGAVEQLLEIQGSVYALTEQSLYQTDARAGDWRRVLEPEGAVLAARNISGGIDWC